MASTSGKHTVSVKINGVAHTVAGLRETQNWIENELIGASYTLFTNSLFYVQDNTNNFTSLPASDRKDLLLEIVRGGDFDTNYEKAKEAIVFFSQEKTMSEASISTLQKAVIDTHEGIKSKGEFESLLSKIRLQIVDLTSEKDVLNSIMTSYSSIENEGISKEKVLSVLNREKESLNREIKEIEELLTTAFLFEGYREEKACIESELDSINKQIETLENSIELMQNENRIKSEFFVRKPSIGTQEGRKDISLRQIRELEETPNCPAEDDCPYMKNKNKQIEACRKIINEADKKMEEETQNFLIWQEQYNQLPEHENAKISVDITAKNLNKAKISEKQKRLTEIEVLLSKEGEIKIKEEHLLTIRPRIDKLDAEILETTKELEELNRKINKEQQAIDAKNFSEITVKLQDLQKDEIGYMAMIAHVQILEKNQKENEENLDKALKKISESERKIDLLTTMKEAFGSKGLKTVVLDFVLPSLEYEINKFLSRMSNFKVRLDTQKEKATNENDKKEGLFITIINEMGEELDYDSYSGGEKVRIKIAISEALASLGKNVGFRVIDEAVNGLDPNMTENFATIFTELQKDYPQMLITSHLPEIQMLFDNVIEVRKKNGVSYVNTEKCVNKIKEIK
jgi:exonuclease SbcC